MTEWLSLSLYFVLFVFFLFHFCFLTFSWIDSFCSFHFFFYCLEIIFFISSLSFHTPHTYSRTLIYVTRHCYAYLSLEKSKSVQTRYRLRSVLVLWFFFLSDSHFKAFIVICLWFLNVNKCSLDILYGNFEANLKVSSSCKNIKHISSSKHKLQLITSLHFFLPVLSGLLVF